jgi:hypothetical protein
MKLRFPESKVKFWADRFDYGQNEDGMLSMRASVQSAGHLTKDQLRIVARWKSPRSAGNIEKNTDAFIREITGMALRAKDERARIEPLTLMDGVRWPTASVILHVFHSEPYPILDFRALWSVSVDVPSEYSMELWTPYTAYCRKIANRAGVSMRDLDRALWQFSKEHQV